MSDACASALAMTTRCFSPPLSVANARASRDAVPVAVKRLACDHLIRRAFELERAEVRVPSHQHHVDHAEVERRVRFLRHDGDAPGQLAPCQLLDRLAADPHAAGERRQNAGHDAKQRRFPRSVRTEKADDGSAFHLEGHAISTYVSVRLLAGP